jgi:hypothetical protein
MDAAEVIGRVRAWDPTQTEEQVRVRLEALASARIVAGGHSPPRSVSPAHLCMMEGEAYIAGEPWSDHPECACPVIASFLRAWNDAIRSDEERARVYGPLRGITVGTSSTREVEVARSWMALDWLVREHTAAWLDLTPALRGHAAALRALPEITEASIASTRPVIAAARTAARTAAGAAAARITAARTAAARTAAARAAAARATGAAAATAARTAAAARTVAAARATTGIAEVGIAEVGNAAAWIAAADGSWDALTPTVERLQASAQDLVRRMAAVGRGVG